MLRQARTLSADETKDLTALAGLEREQEKMKAVNAYHRKHKTLEGCPQLTQDEIETLNASMARDWRSEPKPYPSFRLTNNNAVIRQTKKRIEELSAKAEMEYKGWRFDSGEVKMDREINRLQVFFDAKPDRETCSAMRHEGFRWAPSVGAWQRQLNENAICAAKGLDFLQPLAPAQPTQAEPVQRPDTGWRFYIIADLKTWADNAENRSPLEHFDSFEAAKARFEELRGQVYNSETVEPGPDGLLPARLTLGVASTDGMSAADILHVRQGQNYLVADFVRMERLRGNPQVMDALARTAREIGFDFVRVHEQADEKTWTSTVVSFAEWDNPYFPAAAPGSIAARYHDLLRQCYPLPKDNDVLRKAQVEEVTRYILDDGRPGAIQLSLVIDGVAASCPNNAGVQKLATELVRDLVQCSALEREPAPKQKAQHKKSQER